MIYRITPWRGKAICIFKILLHLTVNLFSLSPDIIFRGERERRGVNLHIQYSCYNLFFKQSYRGEMAGGGYAWLINSGSNYEPFPVLHIS